MPYFMTVTQMANHFGVPNRMPKDHTEEGAWAENDGRLCVQVVGNSGTYTVEFTPGKGITRDDRPWQMRLGVS